MTNSTALASGSACPAHLASNQTISCDCALQVLHSNAERLAQGSGVDGQSPPPLREPPAVLPVGKRLGLDMTLTTYPGLAGQQSSPDYGDMFIGKYRVTGAPVIKLGRRADQARSRVRITDAIAGKSYFIDHQCLQRPELAYGGTLWRPQHGHRLRLTFRSALSSKHWRIDDNCNAPATPKNAANIHTHGAIVAPTRGDPDKKTPYGDYVLDVTVPNAGAAVMPNCQKTQAPHEGQHSVVAPQMEYDIPIPARRSMMNGPDPLADRYHPSGLFWLHTHPHGYSRPQLNGATSHLIAIGGIGDYVSVSGISKNQNVRHLHLKDAQITLNGANSANPMFQTGDFNTKYEPKLCINAPTMGDSPRLGECLVKGERGAHPQAWVFTVNGQQYPRIVDIRDKEHDIWRIANASPNVTYRLQIVKLDLQDGQPIYRNDPDLGWVRGGAVHPFSLLAVDGVAVGLHDTTIGAAAPFARAKPNPPKEIAQIIMMPGSRAEILLQGFEPGHYVLRQIGIDTGGDKWPMVDLMEIVVPGSGLAKINSVKPTKSTPAPITPPKDLSALAPMCVAGGPTPTRKVIFGLNNNQFGLIAGVYETAPSALSKPVFFKDGARDARDASDIWSKLDKGPGIGFGMHTFGDVCSYISREEIWILENWSSELHNFHIHQSRFQKFSPPSNLKEFYEQTPEPPAPAGRARNAREEAHVRSLRDVYRQMGVGAPTAPVDDGAIADESWAMAHHDSIPVPRAVSVDKNAPKDCDGAPQLDESKCKPGRVSVRIRFQHSNQIGRFVYHCHILEHEDNGMMAAIEVCDPKNPSPSCAAPKPLRSGALAPPTPAGGAHRH